MNRIKQHIASKRRVSPLFWVLLIIVVLGVSVGGVSAYLTWASDPVENQFSTAEHPVTRVNTDNSITVQNPGYAVYLRATVVVNWENTDQKTILADMPVADTDYTLTVGDDWAKHDDTFYYYKNKIVCGSQEEFHQTNPVVTVTPLTTKAGYNLKVTVLAQTIQAVGTTDDNSKSAVEDAWGIAPEQITAP